MIYCYSCDNVIRNFTTAKRLLEYDLKLRIDCSQSKIILNPEYNADRLFGQIC